MRTDALCPACGHLVSYHEQPGGPRCIGSTAHRGVATAPAGRCECAEVADAVRGIGPRWDEESREVEASLERSDAFWRNHSRTEAQA